MEKLEPTLYEKISVKKLFLISLIVAFIFVIIGTVLGPLLDRFTLISEEGPWIYAWQLEAPTIWSRITSWGGYALHQISIWIIFFLAIKEKKHPDKLSKLNIIAIFVNLGFIILHLIQTIVFYDGIAQDVPTQSSQWSVIVMLGFILVMMMPRRGLIAGVWKTPPKNILVFLRKFHGFYISWALIYTFWFHPVEGNWGMQSGFLYMYFLFIQLSFFNTKIHFNIKWITFLEFFVVVHAVLITTYKNSGNWPMFLFGFLFMFAFTQIFGLTKKKWLSFGIMGFYLLATFLVFLLVVGIENIYVISFVPSGLYGMALLLIFLGFISKFFIKEKQIN